MTSGRRVSTSSRGVRGKQSKTSAPARGKRGKAAKSASARTAEQRIAPLYKRLPHGPHRLKRDEVVRNQRARIHGAMVEAVGSDGYEATSIKQVIALAGVSRRSFYEQFANKQECFLATFDLIARQELQQIRRAYLSARGGLAERARASCERLAKVAGENPAGARLALVVAQTAGAEAAAHVRRAAGACEHMLAQSFAQTPGAVALPAPVVRAIAGGLQGVAVARLRLRDEPGAPDLAEELLAWMLSFQTQVPEGLSESLSARLSARAREISSDLGNGRVGAEAVGRDERSRVLQAVLRLLTREHFRAISAPQIADEANVSVDRFCELFESKDECLLEALDAIGDELLAIAADPELVSEDWPRAVRRVLDELMRYLAAHPLQTRALCQDAFFAGSESRERAEELALAIATLLTEGAPARARGELVVEAVAGALWHTLRCHVVMGRVPLLAALSDHITYVVLTPLIGAQAAVEALLEEPRAGTASAAGETGASASGGGACATAAR